MHFNLDRYLGLWMPRGNDQSDETRIAENLRRAIELTELGLTLRASVLRRNAPGDDNDIWVQVMRDVRRAKEQAWRQNPS